jgi:rubredoxin
MNWKCDNCGFTFTSEADKLPGKCPSCNQKCTFLNVTCYTPDCQLPNGTGSDPRIGNKD